MTSGLRLLVLLLTIASGAARAQLASEPLGISETLTPPYSARWFWATDPLLQRLTLIDADDDRMLGTVDGGKMLSVPLLPRHNPREFYLPETHYSRGSRGERSDVLTVYDVPTLRPVAEIALPPKRAMNALPIGNAALSDDEQFAAVFNMTPAQSISVVDVQARRLVGEIATPGCTLVYPAGPRRFLQLCGDGRLQFITLASDGSLASLTNSAVVFDPQHDPLTEKAARLGDVWYFVSFAGDVYPIDTAVADPAQLSRASVAPWSLLSDAERADQWRVGGRQFVATDAASGRLFVLMHRGDVDTHKEGGTHLWVFDTARRERVATTGLWSPGFTFSGVPTEFGADWVWPFNQLYNWLSAVSFVEPLARPDAIAITEEAEPRLLLTGQFTGMVAVYDANTLKLQHRVTTGNISNLGLYLPHWGGRP